MIVYLKFELLLIIYLSCLKLEMFVWLLIIILALLISQVLYLKKFWSLIFYLNFELLLIIYSCLKLEFLFSYTEFLWYRLGVVFACNPKHYFYWKFLVPYFKCFTSRYESFFYHYWNPCQTYSYVFCILVSYVLFYLPWKKGSNMVHKMTCFIYWL